MSGPDDRRDRAREILADVENLPPARRDSMIERACADDAELLREVRRLAEGSSGVSGDEGAVPAAPTVESTGDRIGHYVLVEPIGEGGWARSGARRRPSRSSGRWR